MAGAQCTTGRASRPWAVALGALLWLLAYESAPALISRLPVAREAVSVRRAIPLSQVPGTQELMDLSPVFREKWQAVCDNDGGSVFELLVPEEPDVQSLADLVDGGFERMVQDRKAEGEQWGPVAGLWNGWVTWSERQLTLGALRRRLARFLAGPSLQRPQGAGAEEWNLSVMLVPQRSGPQAIEPAAYF
ncbi:unnamed protein product, partial [Polarella glacialis]